MTTVSRDNTVAIIVLNWNCALDTIKCIESLLAQTYEELSIIVVDNASDDDSVSVLNTYIDNYPITHKVKLLCNTKNSGFTGGNNFGFKYALSKNFNYIGTLNPDAVANKNWLEVIISEMNKDNRVGIGGGILLHPDNHVIDSTGEGYSKWGLAFPINRNLPLDETPERIFHPFGITGGAVIYRSSLLQTVGMFDEKFFMYYEDVDLSFRAQLAGYSAVYTPKAVAYHRHGASAQKVSGLTTYQTFKNLPLVIIKNVPSFYLPIIYPRFFVAYSILFLNSLVHGRGWSAFKGCLMSFILTPHAFIARLSIQKRRQVSNQYIRSIIWNDLPPDQLKLRKFRKLFTGKS